MAGSITDLENTVLNQAALKKQMKTGSTVRGTILKKKPDLFIQRSERLKLKEAEEKEGKEA